MSDRVVYDNLFAAVDGMASSDESESFYIDAATKAEAQEFLRLLSSFSVPPPRLFSHGGDAVTFVWDSPSRRLYVTPMDGGVDYYEAPQ